MGFTLAHKAYCDIQKKKCNSTSVFYCSLISATHFSFRQKTTMFTEESDSHAAVESQLTQDNPKVSRTSLVNILSSLLFLLFLEPVQNYLKSITVLQPKLWRKQTGNDERRRDNRPIILVPACFCSSCLFSCQPGDSNLPTKSLTGPLARESKHKNKESTFPTAGRSEC